MLILDIRLLAEAGAKHKMARLAPEARKADSPIELWQKSVPISTVHKRLLVFLR
jgi:hypothetical protein